MYFESYLRQHQAEVIFFRLAKKIQTDAKSFQNHLETIWKRSSPSQSHLETICRGDTIEKAVGHLLSVVVLFREEGFCRIVRRRLVRGPVDL